MQTEKPKNIVLLMADQHQADMMACAGDGYARTPNIDRLAQQGALFERAYCQGPLCMPARASLVTERFVRDHGVFENSSEIPSTLPTFTQRLREAGYHTAEIGKMHLWPQGRIHVKHVAEMTDYMTKLGFDESVETVGKLASAAYDTAYTDHLSSQGLLDQYRQFIRAQHHSGGSIPAWDTKPGPIEAGDYTDTWHGDKAVSWINAYQSDRPFFLWVGFPGPHDPYDAPTSAVERFANGDVPMPRSNRLPELPESGPMRFFLEWLFRYSDSTTMTDQAIATMRRAYYANIGLIDEAVGRVVSALADAGRLDDTWIIYTSDHGELMGERRMITKMAFFEQAVRVPMVIRPPGGSPARRVREPVQLMDLAATFRDIAQAEAIADSAAKSLRGVVEQAKDAPRQAVIISENYGFAMFLAGRHKLVVYEDDVLPVQLFDLEADPTEDHNQLTNAAYSEVLSEMMETHVRPFFAVKPQRPHPDVVQRAARRAGR